MISSYPKYQSKFIFEDVEKMKVRINTIESRLELIGKLNLEIKTLEQKIKLMSTINHND